MYIYSDDWTQMKCCINKNAFREIDHYYYYIGQSQKSAISQDFLCTCMVYNSEIKCINYNKEEKCYY